MEDSRKVYGHLDGGLYGSGGGDPAECKSFGSLIFWAMVLFLAADGLLEIRFPAGATVFALGHGLLIVWYFLQGGLHPMTAAVFVVLCLAAILLFRRECRKLWGEKKYQYLIGLLFYLAFLMLMSRWRCCSRIGGRKGVPACGRSLCVRSFGYDGRKECPGRTFQTEE